MEYKIGMVTKGEVTGIQPYGAFVSLDEETQGLIHISECRHGYVKEVGDLLKVGDRITVMIIDIDEYTKKISLSLRALEDPQTFVYYPKKKRHYTKKGKIGFQSIRETLPKWIKQAKEDEKNQINSR